MTTRNDIETVLWKACDSFRGKIDSSRYKDYILSMLFVKYLSDVTCEKRAQYVIMHELCHLIYADHAKQFYAFLTMQMPDWKERKATLDQTAVYWL